MRVGDAKRVGRRSVAKKFTVDRRAAGFRVLQFFEHDHRASFA